MVCVFGDHAERRDRTDEQDQRSDAESHRYGIPAGQCDEPQPGARDSGDRAAERDNAHRVIAMRFVVMHHVGGCHHDLPSRPFGQP